MPCLKWKENKREHREEDLFNLSSDNVYFLFVSYGRFQQQEEHQLTEKLVISVTKVLQKRDYYFSLLTVVHCFFMRVEITCEVNEKQFVLS